MMARKVNALLLIDIQNDFMPSGTLPVPHGDEVIEITNQLLLNKNFDFVIASQDFHPENHSSFHTLWPVHCVQHSKGAELVSLLEISKINKIIQKGLNPDIDSYSAFFDNAHFQKTELDDYLKKNNISVLYISGVATEYCVKFSVLDALSLGYQVFVVQDACRGIEINKGDIQNAFEEMQNSGAVLINANNIKI